MRLSRLVGAIHPRIAVVLHDLGCLITGLGGPGPGGFLSSEILWWRGR